MLNVLAGSITCGGMTMDALIPNLTSTIVTIVKIFIPIALIFLGMLDLGKAVIGNEEKVMKEAQSRLIKRFVYAILVFIIVSLVQLVFGFLSKADSEDETGAKSAMSCVACFINGPESSGCASK